MGDCETVVPKRKRDDIGLFEDSVIRGVPGPVLATFTQRQMQETNEKKTDAGRVCPEGREY